MSSCILRNLVPVERCCSRAGVTGLTGTGFVVDGSTKKPNGTDLHGYMRVNAASYKRLTLPEKKDHVAFPERRRLKIMQKVPELAPAIKAPKMMKDLHLMRGPEEVHNKLQYGDYGIQAVTGGRLDHKVCETARMIIVRQMDDKKCFAIWRHQNLWQAVSKKGQGQRMGSGKGAIDHYVVPFRAEKIVLELGGYLEADEARLILNAICKVLPFRSRIVSHDLLNKRKEREAWEEENNTNPFTFKYCAQNNVLGCHSILNRYDHMWYGKYR